MKKGPLSARLGKSPPNVFPTEELNGNFETPRSLRDTLIKLKQKKNEVPHSPKRLTSAPHYIHTTNFEDEEEEDEVPPKLPTTPPPPPSSVPSFPPFRDTTLGASGDSLWMKNPTSQPSSPSTRRRRSKKHQFWGAGEMPSSRRSEMSANIPDTLSEYPASSRPDTPGAIHPSSLEPPEIPADICGSDPVEEFTLDDSSPRAAAVDESTEDAIAGAGASARADSSSSDHRHMPLLLSSRERKNRIGSRKSCGEYSIILDRGAAEFDVRLIEKLRKLFRHQEGHYTQAAVESFSSSYNCWRDGDEYDGGDEDDLLIQIVGMLYEISYDADPEGFSYKLNLGGITKHMFDFINIPTPPGFTVRCRLVRRKHGVEGSFYPQYYMFLEKSGEREHDMVFILTARRRRSALSSSYIITTNPAENQKESKYCVGILDGNFKRSKFDLFAPLSVYDRFEGDIRPVAAHLLTVSFKNEEDRLGGSRSPRVIRVATPKLKEDYLRMIMAEKKARIGDEDFIQLKNREPTWSQSSGTYVLNFSNRVTKSSIKNFILCSKDVDTKDHNILLFGKVSKDEFSLDFGYPLCPLQAFAIALASFDVKWGME